MLWTILQAESDVLRKRSTVAPWSIISLPIFSFKRVSHSFPLSNLGLSLSHIVVARTRFFAPPKQVSSLNMKRWWWAIRRSEIGCTYTIPNGNIRFLYLRRCGHRDVRVTRVYVTRRTFSSAIRQSGQEFPRWSWSCGRILVCLQERCGIHIARDPESGKPLYGRWRSRARLQPAVLSHQWEYRWSI